MKINTFILSQVREKQNELIMTEEPIDKIQVSNIIFSFYEAMKEKETFFRCTNIHKHIVAALYWKVNIPELASGRTGLYIIIGFLMDDCNKNFDVFWSYSINFFRLLENQFDISMQSSDGDKMYEIIQRDATAMLKKIETECGKLQYTLCDIVLKKDFWIRRIKSRRLFKKMCYIYMLNDEPDFYADWTTFMYEAFLLIDTWGNVDVSTLKDYTMFSIQLMQNGSKMLLSDVNKVKIMKFREYKYLKML